MGTIWGQKDAWLPLCGIFVHRDESEWDKAGIGGSWGYYLGLTFLCLPPAATQWPRGWGTAGECDAVCPAPLRVPLRPLPDLAPAAERVSIRGMDPCILYPSSPCSSFLSFQRSCQHEGEEQIQVRPSRFAPRVRHLLPRYTHHCSLQPPCFVWSGQQFLKAEVFLLSRG